MDETVADVEQRARMDAKDIPRVRNVRQLTCADADEISALVDLDVGADRMKYNDFDLILADEQTQQNLIDQDMIIGDVDIQGKPYKFIHGYPGDEPCGVIYNADLTVVSGLHWSADKGIDVITDWYLESVNDYYMDDDGEDEFETVIPRTWFA